MRDAPDPQRPPDSPDRRVALALMSAALLFLAFLGAAAWFLIAHP